jgi:hypothetical protein
MFSYEANWSDAAVRRFIRKVGPGSLDDLLALRAADNVGSGLPAESGMLRELSDRVRNELSSNLVLDRKQLEIDGNDLQAELGIGPGREIGVILDELTERVIAEPALNDRAILLELARTELAGGRAGRPAGSDSPAGSSDSANEATR